MRENQKGKNNSQYGTCWITNGIENKKIKKSDLKDTVSRLQKKVKNYKIGIKEGAMVVESREKKLTIKDLQRIKRT